MERTTSERIQRGESRFESHERVRRGSARMGCVIALVVVLLLLVAGVLTTVIMWRSIAAWGADKAVHQALAKVEMNDQERAEVEVVVDDMLEDVRSGELTMEDVSEIARALANGPAALVAASGYIKSQYLAPSALTAEEKDRGRRTIDRLVVGIDRGMISGTKVEAIVAPISAPPKDDSVLWVDVRGVNMRLKRPEDVPTEDLRTMLQLAQDAVDDAGVPDERLNVDLAAALREAVELAKVTGRGDPAERDPAEPAADDEQAAQGPTSQGQPAQEKSPSDAGASGGP